MLPLFLFLFQLVTMIRLPFPLCFCCYATIPLYTLVGMVTPTYTLVATVISPLRVRCYGNAPTLRPLLWQRSNSMTVTMATSNYKFFSLE